MTRLSASLLLTAAMILPVQAMPIEPAPEASTEQGDPSDGGDVREIAIESYLVRRGFRAKVELARAARDFFQQLPPSIMLAEPIVGGAVTGKAIIPVILVTFSNSGPAPYPAADLQTELFDGPWPTGTMSEHYKEMSGGQFEVDGEVMDWLALPQVGEYYAGPAGCNGTCTASRLPEMLATSIGMVDAATDFGLYDNDGPDNVPNSGDDDGYVDFVAFVHPESGGECRDNNSIWSHRYSIRGWTGQDFTTNDSRAGGGQILIDDYVVMPALACNRTTMIQIGVFSHEFGHAFGLPDLYDTAKPRRSAGMGNWELMATGSWGGNNVRPERPSHMTGWAKEYLGWITPRVVLNDETAVELRPIETSGDAIRIDYDDTADPEDARYLLLEFRSRTGFDDSLRADGLMVTEVNNIRVQGGLVNNSVNANQFDQGVNIVEADGLRDLDNNRNRSDAGDLFVAGGTVTSADSTHVEGLRAALCNIVVTATKVTLDIYTNQTTCPANLAAVAVTPAEAMAQEVIAGKEVVITGVLRNAGTNYFTDRDLVIEGPGGQALQVNTSLILETPDPGGPAKTGDLLDQNVIARGSFVQQLGKDGNVVDVFTIKEFSTAQ